MSSVIHQSFDHTLQITHVWLKELAEQLGDPQLHHRAYQCLRVYSMRFAIDGLWRRRRRSVLSY